MNNIALEKLLRQLFHSENSADWKDREAWRRRALFWKMLAVTLVYDNKSEEVNSMYAKAKSADMKRSISEDELMWCLRFFNATINRANARSQLILPPELSLK